jgi:hypothetical protein
MFGAAILSGNSNAEQQAPAAPAASTQTVQLDQLGNIRKGVPFPADNGDITGDHLILRADAFGFTLPRDPNKKFCSYRDARFVVTKDSYVQFYFVTDEKVKKSDAPHVTCPADTEMVTYNALYIADEETQKTMSYERTGFAFGTLVVPFKFRLGGDKKLVSSSTIAPYLGFRHHKLQGFSMDLMPVASAGLGIVPVYNPDKKENESKAAFSTAIGITLTSSKNSTFNAGLLIGKDYLSKSDRNLDPSVNKVWLSLWLGISH